MSQCVQLSPTIQSSSVKDTTCVFYKNMWQDLNKTSQERQQCYLNKTWIGVIAKTKSQRKEFLPTSFTTKEPLVKWAYVTLKILIQKKSLLLVLAAHHIDSWDELKWFWRSGFKSRFPCSCELPWSLSPITCPRGGFLSNTAWTSPAR